MSQKRSSGFRRHFLLHTCIHLHFSHVLRSLWQSGFKYSTGRMWGRSRLCSSVFIAVAVIRHYNTYTNSPQEWTNNGLKAGASPVMAQYSLDRLFNHNGQIKATSSSILSANAVSSNSLWLSLSTSQRSNHKDKGLTTQQWNLRNNYISQRVAEKDWWVSAKHSIQCSCSSRKGLASIPEGNCTVESWNDARPSYVIVSQGKKMKQWHSVGPSLAIWCHRLYA